MEKFNSFLNFTSNRGRCFTPGDYAAVESKNWFALCKQEVSLQSLLAQGVPFSYDGLRGTALKWILILWVTLQTDPTTTLRSSSKTFLVQLMMLDSEHALLQFPSAAWSQQKANADHYRHLLATSWTLLKAVVPWLLPAKPQLVCRSIFVYLFHGFFKDALKQEGWQRCTAHKALENPSYTDF